MFPTVLEDDVWELYNTKEDFSLVNNLADQYPERVAAMEATFMEEAEKYNVLPIDDRTVERMNPAIAGRPDLLGGRKSLTLYGGMNGILENTFLNSKNTSKRITADVEVDEGATGVILTQGGRFGGWSLYMKDGRPIYTYNFLGLERFTVAAEEPIPPGPATIVMDFDYDGDGLGKGGDATIAVNGKKVASGRIGRTQPLIFSADETADVGLDNQTPVADDIGVGPEETRFTGTINQVVLAIE